MGLVQKACDLSELLSPVLGFRAQALDSAALRNLYFQLIPLKRWNEFEFKQKKLCVRFFGRLSQHPLRRIVIARIPFLWHFVVCHKSRSSERTDGGAKWQMYLIIVALIITTATTTTHRVGGQLTESQKCRHRHHPSSDEIEADAEKTRFPGFRWLQFVARYELSG